MSSDSSSSTAVRVAIAIFVAGLLVAAVSSAPKRAQAATSQTIFFSSISTKTFGSPPFTIFASATSGLPVSFSVDSGQCTLDQSLSPAKVTLTGAGSCSIRASQAGNATYSPAPDVVRTFTINKANQTVSFGYFSTIVPFSAGSFGVSATATSGLPVSIAIVSGPCTVPPMSTSPATVTITGAGTCQVSASQPGDANYYAATTRTRSVTITKGSQTISLSPIPSGLTYGDAPVPVTATASSGLPVTLAIISGPCSILTDGNTGDRSISLDGAGFCWLQASQPGDASYNAAFPQNKTFNVAKAPLTVTADSIAAKPYGAPIPPISGTPAGFVGGDTLSDLSGSLVCSAWASSLSSPGTYPTTCSGLSSLNYNITYLPGTLTVVKADQTLSIVGPTTRTVGDLPFTLTTSSVNSTTLASTGLFVTLSSDTPLVCTVSSSWFGPVTIIGPGTCTIRATQAGNPDYNPATVTLDITINPAP